MGFETRRRLLFSLPTDLDTQMRRIAFARSHSPGKGTVGEYVELAVRAQMARDMAALGEKDLGTLGRMLARFSNVPGPDEAEVAVAGRMGSGLTPGKVRIRAGNCDPARWVECKNRQVHEFLLEPPVSIGPSVCVRCGYERRDEDVAHEWGPAFALWRPEHEAVALADAARRAGEDT